MLTAREIDQLRLRTDTLRSAAPAMSAESFAWLHKALFVGIDTDAGNLRSYPLSGNGFDFARPCDILPSLEERFACLANAGGFLASDSETFYHRLAHHVVELYAISPFSLGNRRTLALHAMQIANAAGYSVHISEVRRVDWDEALDRGFCDGDSSAVACLLSGLPINQAARQKENWTGVGGIALLPTRYPPRGRRYLTPLNRARVQLERSLPSAIDEAEAQLAGKAENGVALQELAWLRHEKGPRFQLDLLESTSFGKIEVVSHQSQGALERVREIGYGLMIGILQQPEAAIIAAIRNLARRRYAKSGSPHLDRMADQFLQNNRYANENDPRFAALQHMLDESVRNAAILEGGDASTMAALVETLRHKLSERIRRGETGFEDAEMVTRKLRSA
jgi:fido (protein-threonine AMPylation protein)